LGLSLGRTIVEAAPIQILSTMARLPEVGRWIILTIGKEEFKYKVLRHEEVEEREYVHGSVEPGVTFKGFKYIQNKIVIVKSPTDDGEDFLDKHILGDNEWKYIQQ
jgi:hypothetical protein